MSDNKIRRIAMVDTQVRPSDVTKFPIIEAMLSVPREIYVPLEKRDAAYIGENLSLGPDRVILEPRTLAKMLDGLDIRKDELVLDIGSGLGYSAAVIARMAEAVVAVESDEDQASEAQVLLADQNVDNVVVHQGALPAGAADHGPYDVIIVQGGIEIIPDALAAQLKNGGRIACLFMQGKLGVVKIGLKEAENISWRPVFNAGAPLLAGFERVAEFEL
ncbi:protein-L-isoaspartate O-methyltransferase [Cognatishimia sp. WU-CL00825]|uniref:protein-L-isoaspartate O-methyltransferase family protein n=1 Tax=Cognatishimia sp. WU-CL00825 TaxID=3127658 RepID=UPI0031073E1C